MDALTAALLEPRAYPDPVDDVRLIETHISRVFLAGDFAYKLKKPVSFGFLDFSSLEARRRFCFEELRLNRRFAPALYLDVVAIVRGPDGPCVAGAGEVLEFAVRMRRFADGALLAERAADGVVPRSLWWRLGVDLARLHLALPRAPADDPDCEGVPPHFRDALAENLRQIRPYLRERSDIDVLNVVEERTWADWRRLESLLWRRHAAGWVRECHGDLHLGNLLIEGEHVLPFDCIEFNARLRWIDVMSEMAFLVMDCEARGVRQRAGRRFRGPECLARDERRLRGARHPRSLPFLSRGGARQGCVAGRTAPGRKRVPVALAIPALCRACRQFRAATPAVSCHHLRGLGFRQVNRGAGAGR